VIEFQAEGAKMRKASMILSLATILFIISGCVSIPEPIPEPCYTAHNIWFEDPQEIFAINYKRGVIIPAGTEVKNISRHSDPDSIRFTAEGYGRFTIEIVPRWQPGLTTTELVDRTFSSQVFDELVIGLTDREIELIKKGEVGTGMSKKAVLISYGYPPLHKTRSLNNKIWYYWLSRIRQQMIVFDQNWKVIQIKD
jgi:hypothetical protein